MIRTRLFDKGRAKGNNLVVAIEGNVGDSISDGDTVLQKYRVQFEITRCATSGRTYQLLANERVVGGIAGEARLPDNAARVDAELGCDIGQRGVLQVVGGALAQRMIFTLAEGLHDKLVL